MTLYDKRITKGRYEDCIHTRDVKEFLDEILIHLSNPSLFSIFQINFIREIVTKTAGEQFFMEAKE